jgi:hydroxyacylglutathione hydrolase
MTDTSPQRIPIAELRQKLESARKPTVIDVRDKKEVAETGSIPGALHIPMSQVEKRMVDFPKNSELVFY